MKLLIEKVSAVKIGDSLGAEMANVEGGQMGPVVNDVQYHKVHPSSLTPLTNPHRSGPTSTRLVLRV
jgi:hypothetical protein